MADINAYRLEAIPCRKTIDRMVEDRKKNGAIKARRTVYGPRVISGIDWIELKSKDNKPLPRTTRYAFV